MAAEVLSVIGFFSSLMIFGIMYLRNRHRERLALIQYGKDSSVFNKGNWKNAPLKMGLLLLSMGAGILVGSIIDSIFNSAPVGIFSCVFLLGGFALIYYHQYVSGKIDINLNRSYKMDEDIDDEIL